MLKNTFKKCVMAPALIASFAFTPIAFSQDNLTVDGTLVNTHAGSGGEAYVGGPGNWDITKISQDNDAMVRQILDQNYKLQQQDRDYLMSVSERVNNLLQDMLVLRDKVIQMSQESNGTLSPEESICDGLGIESSARAPEGASPVSISCFTSYMNELRTSISSLRVELSTATQLTADNLPSGGEISVGDLDVTAPNIGNVVFDNLKDVVENAVTDILEELSGFTVKIITPAGQTRDFTAADFNPDLKGLEIITAEEYNVYRNKAADLTGLSEDAHRAFQYQADYIVNQINNFVRMHALEERWRVTNGFDDQAARTNFKRIVDFFQMRAYL